ncbi:hypothetical protein CMO94_01165 [Candidatus Woesearchaeota archaeon]|nr:hypothetical protein [Candidatus Woesearchaeota archaeon]
MDVDGGVRVGRYTTSSRPSCIPSTVGMFIFDTDVDKNRPYVCAVGNVWKPLDSDFDEDGLIEWLDPNDNSFNSQCSADNGGQCYLSQGSKSSLDGDLSAGNIKSGVNIFGVSGTLQTGGPTKDCQSGGMFVPSFRELEPGCDSWCGARGFSGSAVKCTQEIGKPGWVSDTAYDWDACTRRGTRQNENDISWCILDSSRKATCFCF